MTRFIFYFTAITAMSMFFGLSSVNAETAVSRSIVVAAVQMPNIEGDYAGSKLIAERLIGEAADRGAQIVLLPEFALIGYRFSDDIWKAAEPLDGPTAQWMRGLCKRYNIYIATCILELRENDFYDTMILVGPGDGELWAHRKIEPAIFESYYFRGAGVNPAVFDTPLGRIGLVICMDSSKTHTISNLIKENPELVLMTFSAPQTPIVTKKMKQGIIDIQNNTAVIYSHYLDAPIVLVNKTGKWDTPLPGFPGIRARSDFVARSRIVDADGKILASLEKEEAVITAKVDIGKKDAAPHPSPPAGRWLMPYDPVSKIFADSMLRIGGARYKRSNKRIKAVEETQRRYAEKK